MAFGEGKPMLKSVNIHDVFLGAAYKEALFWREESLPIWYGCILP